jgi:hypothetical protein
MQNMFLKFIVFIILVCGSSFTSTKHPIFVSVTEIEQNIKEKSLEVSCKIFTDDFEKALRVAYKTKVDLLDAKLKPAMDKLVNDYIVKHLKVNVEGKIYTLKYVGFERIEEAIYCYFEVENIITPKKIIVTNDLLYEYKKEQMSLIHITIGGKRQSKKLTNPEKVFAVNF